MTHAIDCDLDEDCTCGGDDRMTTRGTAYFQNAGRGQRTHAFEVDIARTAEDRARGLLGAGPEFYGRVGMVLEFDPPSLAAITTSEMRIPIDVVFVRPSGDVTRTESETRARASSHIYQSDELVRWVVELPSGTVRQFDVRPGTRFWLVG